MVPQFHQGGKVGELTVLWLLEFSPFSSRSISIGAGTNDEMMSM